jgi:Spy/CpxP family protein refolding chaperone
MKIMKFVLLGFAFVLAVGLHAQDAPATKPTGKPQREMQKGPRQERKQDLMQKLNLTTEQAEAFRNINQKHKAEVQALREKSGDQPMDREAMKALKSNHQEMIKNILTPEQFAIYEAEINAAKAETKANRGQRGGKGGSGKGQGTQKAPRG